jgi:ATP-dependent DNA ligase
VERAARQRPRDPCVDRAEAEVPLAAGVSDVEEERGEDLRPLPLSERKQRLKRLLGKEQAVRFVDHLSEAGDAVLPRPPIK